MRRPDPKTAPRTASGLVAVLSLGCSLAALQSARAETLADAVSYAYQTNPTLLQQRQQLKALNETYVQARSSFGPRVSVDATGYEESATYGPNGYRAHSASEELTLSQPLFTGGRGAAALAASEGDVRSGREKLRQAEADLLRQVINAYVAVRRDQQILSVAQGTVTVLQQQLEETRAKVDVKENTRTDLAQAEARLASAQAQVYNVQAQLAASRAQYLNAVGQNPGDLAPEPDLPGMPASVDEAFTVAETGNRQLLAQKYTELASRARVAAAKAEILPTVEMRLQATRSPQALYVPAPYINQLVAQATVSQPLYTSGQVESGIRRATALNNSDRLGIDAVRRNVVQAVSQQWSALSAARNALTADQANVTASETAFYGMRQEERFGLRSTIELLNAEQELTSAQIALLRDRYNEYTARAGVLNLTGRLTVDALAPGVASYDPTVDFDKVKNKGALPTELVVRAVDGLAVPSSLKSVRPANETAVPDQQLPLPPAPVLAKDAPPLRPVTSLMDETRAEPGTDAPIATAPSPAPTSAR